MGRFRRAKVRAGQAFAVAGVFVAAVTWSPLTARAAPGTPQLLGSNVGAVVDPTFLFSISGLNSGQCNGTDITGTGSSATAVSLGSVDKTSRAVGGQKLQVASNAGGGYSVFAKVDGPLNDGAGHHIANLGADSNNPTAFAAPGTEAFGYTTDSSLTGAVPNRFVAGGAKWSSIDTSNREVMYGSTTTTQSISCVAYQITISPNTVGGFYANNVTYTAVPTF